MSEKNKRYIARIKVDNKPIFGLKCLNERDYILTFPNFISGDAFLDFHVSLHTSNNRITRKVVNSYDDKKNFKDFLVEAKNKGHYVTKKIGGELKDIDITGFEQLAKLKNGRHLEKLISLTLRNSTALDCFNSSKSKDSDFKDVFKINFSEDIEDVKFEVWVCKNPVFNNFDFRKNILDKDYFIIDDKINSDHFKFIVFVEMKKIISKKIGEI